LERRRTTVNAVRFNLEWAKNQAAQLRIGKDVCMLGRRVTDLTRQAAVLKRWPAGRIVMQNGRLVEIRCGLIPRRVSVARVWWDNWRRPVVGDQCTLNYHGPIFGGYLTIDYLASGRGTSLPTILGACRVLDEIAGIRGAVAIFAHISTTAVSDRLLLRYGWESHLHGTPGRHWVKRFYNGYPDTDIRPYLRGAESAVPAEQSR
jgi:hypothetical protein